MRYLYIILLFPILFSCTERIDLNLDTMPAKPVVAGIISNNEQWVRLSTTSGYLEGTIAAISGATVTVSDGTSTYAMQESASEKGLYQPLLPIPVMVDKTYKLNVSVTIDGTPNQFSASSAITSTPVIDSLSLVAMTSFGDEKHWVVYAYYQDKDVVSYYLARSFINGQLEMGLESYFVFDNATVERGKYKPGQMIAVMSKRPNSEDLLEYGDTISIEFSSIAKDYYTFLYGASEETQGRNPLFSGPPANVQGNISNGALGVFAAYISSNMAVIIKEKDPVTP